MTIVQLIELAERFHQIAVLDARHRRALKAGRFDDVDTEALTLMASWLASVEELAGNDEELGDSAGWYTAAAADALRCRRDEHR